MAGLRPPMSTRTASSSSFADTFDKARARLEKQPVDAKKDVAADESLWEAAEAEDAAAAARAAEAAADAALSCPGSPASMATGGSTPASPASPLTGPVTSPAAADPSVADNFAFAFDIDGVLIRGGKVIPEAVEAMRVLNGDNEFGIKVPYIFLTNGGGKFETERCDDLSRQLDINVSPGQFICGHTPMRELAGRYGTVLVVGGEGEKCRHVAESYGFRDVITPGDIIKANAATTPFRRLTDAEHANSRDLLERGAISDIVIEAVFVFADSRDWAGDLQIIIDLAMSKGGRLETRSETFDEGPPIYFSHNDVIWSAAHEHARLGMGALRKIVETVYTECTGGKKLETHAFGKPQVSTFEFADRLLRQWRASQHGLAHELAPDTVYFVGDTPESDVRGTNAMNRVADNDWYSILVRTGVYQSGTEPAYKPRKTVETVLDAVRHGIRREMARRAAKTGELLPLDRTAAKAVEGFNEQDLEKVIIVE